jgi:hypothetical protein
MAKKDETLKSFLKHEIFQKKYGIQVDEQSITVAEAKNSEIVIIRTLAELIDSIEGVNTQQKTEQQTYELLTRLLNVSEL